MTTLAALRAPQAAEPPRDHAQARRSHEPDLAFRGLSVAYPGAPRPVFRGVDFTVARGERLALVGPNGAGKSTLLRAGLGLAPVCAGQARLFGQDLLTLDPRGQRKLRSGVGFVAQKHNLVARLSVLSNVMHGFLAAHPGPRQWLHGLAPAALRARALQALAQVGLEDLALRRADRLSGGQSQRVAIARALVAEPRLILADEPAASLDPAAGEEVMATFARVAQSSGATLIFTTHRLDHALTYADRILGLCDGAVALDMRTADVTVETLRALFD